MFKLKDYRDKQKSYGDLLGWFGVIADGVVETVDGHMLASWYFRGEDLASSTPDEMASLSARLNSLLCSQLDGRWSLHVDCMRTYTQGYPERGAFPDRTTLAIDQERRQAYEAEGVHLETTHALTLSWEVPRLAGAKVEGWVFSEGDGASSLDAATHHDRMLLKFKNACADIDLGLSGIVQTRRMKAYTGGTDAMGRPELFDEQLEFFEFCATGSRRAVRLPAIPVYLDRRIGAVGLRTEPLIANTGFATGNVLRLGSDLLVRAVSVTGYPADSSPAMLAALDQLGFEYRWNSRFIVLDQHTAEAQLEGVRRKWKQKQRSLVDQVRRDGSGNVDEDAVAMSVDVGQALSELKSNLVRYGHYTATIILKDRDAEQLAEKVAQVRAELRNIGFDTIAEDINNADAFIGSMPGNRLANVRGAPIHTLNLADLLPLTAVWAGPEKHPSPYYPDDAPALLHAQTTGSTPFRLCLHVDDVGHTLMLGPTGSGKTTALNLMIAQHFRYPGARVFGFDRKYGSYVLCKASDGDYYDIGGPHSKLAFCPLGSIDSDVDQAWATEWIESCCLLQGLVISPGQRAAIFAAVKQLAAGSGRSLSELVALIQASEVREALRHYTLEGPMGHLLDAENDSLGDSRFMMFEMEHLAEMGEKNLVPVMLYLFRQLDKRLTGEPTLVPLDESWLMLTHPLFRSKLQEWLKTWRSKNASVILATQEPADVLKSPIRDVVLASCPTKILLPNPDARGVQREMYEVMGCNETEVDIVSMATRKRHYYYKSPSGRRLFALGLGPVALAFVGASGRAALEDANKVMADYGDTWPEEWLRRKGLPEWADYWRRVQ